MSVRLVTLGREQLPALLEVERASQPLPWSEAQLLEELTHEHGVVRGARDDEQRLVGYAAWRANVDELWLLNLAVLPGARRRGLGRTLVDDGEPLARARGMTSLWLEVRDGNASARRLYQAAGFEVVGQRRGYYPPLPDVGAREDAVIMRRALS